MINVILGISGGVDSSICAYILKKKGYNVVCFFMLNWDEKNFSYCNLTKDVVDAKKVCKYLNIPFYIVNFSYDYWQKVFFYFLNEYKFGKTPNPDVICNSEIKFDIFLEYSRFLGADFIATGHYSKINILKNSYFLCESFDLYKDQTYFLYKLTQHQLKYSIFPLYKYSKLFIRNLAFNIGLCNSMKKDSSGICFVGKLDFKSFLKKYISLCYGPIFDFSNKQIGIHEGIMFYTYGQKKNLDCDFLYYIFNKSLLGNVLFVSFSSKFFSNLYCIIKNVNFINNLFFIKIICLAKIRHGSVYSKCIIKKFINNFFIIEFYFNQKNLSPGQSIVFYKNNICLGGGIILDVG